MTNMRMHRNIISLAILAAFGSVAKSDDGSDESLGMLKMIIMTKNSISTSSRALVLMIGIFFVNVSNSHFNQSFPAANLVKMCLFYGGPSGHARSDPILNQTCASDHVHTVSFCEHSMQTYIVPSLVLTIGILILSLY